MAKSGREIRGVTPQILEALARVERFERIVLRYKLIYLGSCELKVIGIVCFKQLKGQRNDGGVGSHFTEN
jgi:hypothetical protein